MYNEDSNHTWKGDFFMDFKKKLAAACVLTMTSLALPIGVMPVQTVHANIITDVIGGFQLKSAMSKQLKAYDTTKEGQAAIYQQVTKQTGVLNNSYYDNRLASIMNPLSASIAKTDSSITPLPYRWYVSPDTTFNAACTMGHVMVVNKGMFDLLNNDDEIAVVLGHEMGHGQKHHVANATMKKLNVEIGKQVLADSVGVSGLSSLILDTISNQIETVHIDRADEWAADNLSFDYVTNAGYNPGATAAVWQRVIEKQGDNSSNFVGEIFSPSDHPSNVERRDNYAKKLYEMSGKHASVKDGTVYVNGKKFIKPAATYSMSSAERSYFVLGNLAAAYQNGHSKQPATASGGTLYLGPQNIMTPVNGDPSAEELAAQLNKIK